MLYANLFLNCYNVYIWEMRILKGWGLVIEPPLDHRNHIFQVFKEMKEWGTTLINYCREHKSKNT